MTWTPANINVNFANRQVALAFKYCVTRPTLLPPLLRLVNDHPHLWVVAGSALSLIFRAQRRYNPHTKVMTWQDGRLTEAVNLGTGKCSCRERAPSIQGKDGTNIRACVHMVATKIVSEEITNDP